MVTDVRTARINMDDDERHLIERRESQGRGLGIFATGYIPRGTRIVAEPALLKVSRDTTDAKDIVRAFESLSSSQKKSYLELHDYACDLFKRAAEREMDRDWEKIPELHRKVLGVWAANAFGSVFLLGSRINHSCTPNVNFAYNSALEKETYHAVRDIKAGEELTIMYINGTNRTRSQRQDELENWGFQCSCSACEDTPQGGKKEKKRVELFKLDQELAKHTRFDIRFGTKESWRKALKAAQRIAALQKSEGLLNRQLGISYHDAARYSARLGDANMALLWAEKELEVDGYCIGTDHPDYLMELNTVNQLRKAAKSSEPFDQSTIKWFDSYDNPPSEPCAAM